MGGGVEVLVGGGVGEVFPGQLLNVHGGGGGGLPSANADAATQPSGASAMSEMAVKMRRNMTRETAPWSSPVARSR